MPLIPNSPRRERILIFGGDGVGKSDCITTIADKVDRHIWVADGDKAFYQNAEEYSNINFDRMHIYEDLISWTDYVTFAEDVLDKAEPDDWIVIDRIDHLREAAVNYWMEEVHELAPEAWIIATDKELDKLNEARKKKAAKSGSTAGELGLDTEIDYRSINAYYYQYLNKLNIRAKRQHIFMCASARELITEGGWRERNKAVIDKFTGVGMKPQGGSGVTAIPATILYLRTRGKERFLTTIKDRGRERNNKLDNKRFIDFVSTYLMPVGKWKFAEEDDIVNDDSSSTDEGKIQEDN